MISDLDNFNKVREFNIEFGKEVPNQFNYNYLEKSKSCYDLILSELEELNTALLSHPRIHEDIADAFYDINYVIYGYLCYMGITSETFTLTNLTIKYSDDIKTEILALYKIDHTIAMLSSPDSKLSTGDIENKFIYLKDLLICMSSKIINLCKLFGYPYNEGFDIVHKANMSKLCETEEIAIKTVEYYKSIIDKTDYKYPDYRLSPCGNYYVVYNNDNSENPINKGKILKSINWKEPNFSSLRFPNNYKQLYPGINLIIGPMFSDKTNYLFKKYDQYMLQNYKCLLVKYIADNRFGSNEKILITHDGKSRPAIATDNLSNLSLNEYDVILIDEIQFIKFELSELIELSRKKCIYVAGLSGDYLRQPFENISNIIPIANKIKHTRAICLVNGEKASFTKRNIVSQERIIIGDDDIYEAVDLKNYY